MDDHHSVHRSSPQIVHDAATARDLYAVLCRRQSDCGVRRSTLGRTVRPVGLESVLRPVPRCQSLRYRRSDSALGLTFGNLGCNHQPYTVSLGLAGTDRVDRRPVHPEPRQRLYARVWPVPYHRRCGAITVSTRTHTGRGGYGTGRKLVRQRNVAMARL